MGWEKQKVTVAEDLVVIWGLLIAFKVLSGTFVSQTVFDVERH